LNKLNIVVIGLGGIGSILTGRLSRFLNFTKDLECNILLVDGDYYEAKNYERQEFNRIGDKAEMQYSELAIKFPRIMYDYQNVFINENNAHEIIKEKSVVFLCLDNHKSRNVVSNYCKTLNDITIISGGNDFTDGNVQIYVKQGGKELTPDLCAYHPEIASPTDKSPEEMSCEELSESEPQLYFANLGAATIMCWAFYNVVINNDVKVSEVYFDIVSMASLSKIRKVK